MAVKVLYNRRYPKIYRFILRILGPIIYHPEGKISAEKRAQSNLTFLPSGFPNYINASSGISIALVSVAFMALS